MFVILLLYPQIYEIRGGGIFKSADGQSSCWSVVSTDHTIPKLCPFFKILIYPDILSPCDIAEIMWVLI